MASPTRIPGDLVVDGNAQFGSLNLPNLCVGDDQADPNNPITSLKLEHQYNKLLAQNVVTCTSQRQVVHVAKGKGVVAYLDVLAVTAAIGDSTVAIVLKKNGTSMMSGTLTLTSATAAFVTVIGLLTSYDYVAGDVWDVTITPTAGTGTLPTGVTVRVIFREAAE